MNILQAIDDPAVFAPWFERGDWSAWRAFLAALFALPMGEDELAVYRRHTGRSEPPTTPFTEAALICGRRSGKSFILAVIAVYLAVFRDYRAYLQPGERATVLVLASDRRQARAIMRYAVGLLEGVPMLRGLIESQTGESVDLARRVSIEITTASFRSVRGATVCAALCDEIAFWPTDEHSASPDSEITNAIRPAMATIPGAPMLMASSPYARRGELYRAHRDHFGKDGAPVLVWQAETRAMNPSVPESFVAAAFARDAGAAASEYGGRFREDIAAFVSRDVIENAQRSEPLELPFNRAHRYSAFTDPAGGGQDEFTVGIGHHEGERLVVDVVRGMRGVPAEITASYAELLKAYGIREVTGDRFSGSWCSDEFARHKITYRHAEKPKSGLYGDLLPALNSGRVELPPCDRLANQLASLERRTARGGRDSIDHPPGGHDDRANVVAGLVATAAKRSTYDLAAAL
ncbi:MAG: terminase family protein [Pseudomonadota bacterium]|nr:terminase family protein [Pseudomonadota bacterium]